MRIFRYFILFFLLSLPFVSTAQYGLDELDVSFGEKLNMSRRTGLHQIIGADESGLYVLQTKMKKSFSNREKNALLYTLQYFDRKMRKVHEAEISLKHEDEVLAYKFIIQVDGRIYVFLSSSTQSPDTETLFAQEIHTRTLEPLGAIKKIADFTKESQKSYFVHALSDDRSKILISYVNRTGEQDRQVFDLHVLDDRLNPLWSKEANLPYPDKLFTTEQYKVDHKGDVYMLSILYDDKRKHKRSGLPDYRYHLISYRNKGKEENEYAVKLPNKFLTDMKIVVNEQQDIIGGGFYADKGSYHIEGSYFFTIDGTSHEVVSNSVRKFDPHFLDQELPDGHANTKGGRMLQNMGISLNDIILRKDGSAVLVGEQYFVSSSTRLKRKLFGPSRTKTNYFYDYKDIILVNTNAQGAIEWTEKVAKHQHTHNDAGRFSSFSLSVLEDDLYFVFNDKADKGEGMEKSKDTCLNYSKAKMVKVDRGGNQYYTSISKLNNTSLRLMPATGHKATKTEQVFLGGGKKSHRFVWLKLRELKGLTAVNR